MGRWAIIDGGVVVNIAIGAEALEVNWVLGEGAVIGDLYVNGAFTTPTTPAPVPEAVTPVQFRRALRQAGLYDAVTAYVATQDADTQDAWEYAVSIPRSDALVALAAAGLGRTDEEVDDLFRFAATL
jgi:hypothetical protein